MIDDRDLFERAIRRFPPPERSFDRLISRRDRKQRNKRITAGAVGIAIAIAAVLVGTSIIRSDQRKPANPELPFRHNGVIAIAGDGGDTIVYLIDPRTGRRSVLTVCPECRGSNGLIDLAWSPDGTKFAFTISGGNWPEDLGHGTVGVFDVATEEISTIATCEQDPSCYGELGWSPDGSRIALAQQHRLDLLDPDGSNRITLADFSDERGAVYGPTWAPDGGTIAFSVSFNRTSRLYRVDADGSNLQTLIERPGDNGARDPEWSPDGSRIAYMDYVVPENPPEPAGAFPQVWIVDVDGSDPTKLFVGDWCCTGYTTGLSWAPDGTGIAFISGSRHLYLIDPDGGEVQVLGKKIPFGRPSWQPVP